MLTMKRLLLICGYLVASAFDSLAASAADSAQLLPAEVQRSAATPYPIDDPEVIGLRLAMDLQVTNQTGQAAYLPVRENGSPREEGLSIEWAQYRKAGGTWVTLFSALWVDGGNVKYPSCRELPPGRAGTILDSAQRLVLMRKQVQDLGPKPTLRLKLITYCRKPDGQVRFTWTLTEPFALTLPTAP